MTAQVEQDVGPRAWLRSRSTPVRTLLALALPGLTAGALWGVGRREDWDVYPQSRMLVEIGVLAAGLGSFVERVEVVEVQAA